jgi:hypothetical protein
LIVPSFLKDFLQVGILFYIQNRLSSIFSNYHTLSHSLNHAAWEKRYGVSWEIARNWEFHGIGQEVEKSLKNQISLVSLSKSQTSLP